MEWGEVEGYSPFVQTTPKEYERCIRAAVSCVVSRYSIDKSSQVGSEYQRVQLPFPKLLLAFHWHAIQWTGILFNGNGKVHVSPDLNELGAIFRFSENELVFLSEHQH